MKFIVLILYLYVFAVSIVFNAPVFMLCVRWLVYFYVIVEGQGASDRESTKTANAATSIRQIPVISFLL